MFQKQKQPAAELLQIICCILCTGKVIWDCSSIKEGKLGRQSQQSGLCAGVVRGLRLKTGFSATEIFRKYLWYLLRERKFDEDAVADLSALRSVLAMRDEEVSHCCVDCASLPRTMLPCLRLLTLPSMASEVIITPKKGLPNQRFMYERKRRRDKRGCDN